MKARTAVKRVFTHITVWILWYALQLIQNIKIMRFFRTIDWIQVAYNLLSLTIVFYAIASTLTILLEYRRLGVYRKRHRYKIMYLFNVHLLFCGMIVLTYIGTSMFLDMRFFENIYPDNFIHFFKRFDRVLPYLPTALIYGYHIAYRKKQVGKDIYKDELISTLQEKNRQLELWVQEKQIGGRNSLLN
jgi:hypothetical protein